MSEQGGEGGVAYIISSSHSNSLTTLHPVMEEGCTQMLLN